MKKNTHSVDGFVPRRASTELGEHHLPRPIMTAGLSSHATGIRPQHESPGETSPQLARTRSGLSRADIDASLMSIDEGQEDKQKRNKKKRSLSRKKLIKRIIIALLVLLLVAAIWFGAKLILAQRNVFKGDIFGLVQSTELKMDERGRSNILILGTSEDDPGHQASWLTDSIMVLSIDQHAKNAYMISIPRDLEAEYGRACLSGYAGKVNAFFNCVNEDWTSEAAEVERMDASRKFFGDIVGLDIQYGTHVNYTVMRDLVKALGGITVTIESPDPRGQMDANFDWKCGRNYNERIKNCPPRGHYIDYPNGPVELDAEHALYLAQARGDVENWGFPNSNFEREKNQQKIIVAIRDKAVSAGTLLDLVKVGNIIQALGDNLRTNFETSEIRTLVQLAIDIKPEAIQSISLIDNGVITGGAVPTAGKYQFGEIQKLIKKEMYADPVAKEEASVIVLNGTTVVGVAQTQATKLEELGMKIEQVANAPTKDYKTTAIYQINDTNPATKTKLESLYNVTAKKASPPVTVNGETDFVVIIGTATAEQ